MALASFDSRLSLMGIKHYKSTHYINLLLAECALLGDYQHRIQSLKTQYFTSSLLVS